MIRIPYDSLPCTMLKLITNDQVNINPDDWNCPETVVTIKCNHPKQQGSSDLNTAQKQIREQGRYTCSCGQQAKSVSELAKDVKRIIATTFHQSTTLVDIKSGIMLHYYQRAKRYQVALNNFLVNNENSFLDMQVRFHEQNSITNILIKQQYSEKQIQLWAYCLLDRVKINIPVRIINCQHADCYELTSLLLKFDQIKNEINKTFQCEFNGCNNYLNMENLQIISSQLVIDLDYLKVLNAAPNTQFKFIFDFQKKEFVKSPDFDPVVMQSLQAFNIPQDQAKLMYNSIQNHISNILTSDALENPKIKTLLISQKYEDRHVNLTDQFTKYPIEFPVRCLNCPSSSCIDIRTLITDYEIKKKPQGYKCPLCNNTFDLKRQKNFKGQIYLDQSLLSKMFKDQQNNNRQTFFYNGKQYMKEEFIYKQKLSKEDYLNRLDREHPKQERVAEFKNLYCIKNPERQLKTPLIIINCPQSSIVEFETFYEEFQKMNFNIEQDGIKLCSCDYCNFNPIKKYTTELAYHEALGYAIENSTMKTIQKGSTLKFDFKVKQQLLVFGKQQPQNNDGSTTTDGNIIQQVKNQITQGFIEILNDEEYKNVFKPKQLEGKNFQVLSMQVEVMDGLNADCNSQGMNVQVEEKIQQMNQNANQELKKWNFQVTGMEVKVLGFQSGIQSKSFDSSQIQK